MIFFCLNNKENRKRSVIITDVINLRLRMNGLAPQALPPTLLVKVYEVFEGRKVIMGDENFPNFLPGEFRRA